MTKLRPPIAVLAAALAAGPFALAGPAGAQAPGGGYEASPDRPSLFVRPTAMLNRTVTIRGSAGPHAAGRTVRVERLDRRWRWRPLGTATVAEDGTWVERWRANSIGHFAVRATVDAGDGAAAASSAPVAPLTVFRPSNATWYGPGFWGRRTACGQRLRRATLGVAHKTLPCGTQVELYHRGRTITVPVIDRGPFRRGYDWDLTQATARALRFQGSGRIGAVRLTRAVSAARKRSARR